ncbi:trace amine-associated receptor 1-like [Symphorus nematophorus]
MSFLSWTPFLDHQDARKALPEVGVEGLSRRSQFTCTTGMSLPVLSRGFPRHLTQLTTRWRREAKLSSTGVNSNIAALSHGLVSIPTPAWCLTPWETPEKSNPYPEGRFQSRGCVYREVMFQVPRASFCPLDPVRRDPLSPLPTNGQHTQHQQFPPQLCGNLLVITSILYFKQLHTPTNFLILSLAVADLLVGVLLLFYVMIPATEDSCLGLDTFEMYLCASSVWNLCCISVDRYYAVCQPLRYRTKINVCVIVIMILVSWIVSILNLLIIGFQHTFGFYIPAIIMAAIYLKILMVAQRQARSIQNTTCQRTKSESKMQRKATKTLAIVMGVFLICWTPYFLCWTFNPLTNYKIPVPVLSAFTWLGWSNSLLNPFIYAFFYSWFRSAFRMIISGKIFQGDFTNSKLS